jgi:hypothetical protein
MLPRNFKKEEERNTINSNYWSDNPFLSFSFFGGNKVDSGLCAYKAGTLLLEPHLQSIWLRLFWRWSLVNYLPGLALNHNPPNLILPSS